MIGGRAHAGGRRAGFHAERRGPPGSSEICSLFGSTVPFSPQMLVSLYGTTANYPAKYTADLDRTTAAGYLLPSERSSALGPGLLSAISRRRDPCHDLGREGVAVDCPPPM